MIVVVVKCKFAVAGDVGLLSVFVPLSARGCNARKTVVVIPWVKFHGSVYALLKLCWRPQTSAVGGFEVVEEFPRGDVGIAEHRVVQHRIVVVPPWR